MIDTSNVNPLKLLNLSVEYKEMAKQMGVHANSVCNIANMDKERVGNLKLKVAKQYKEVLGVDLIEYYNK